MKSILHRYIARKAMRQDYRIECDKAGDSYNITIRQEGVDKELFLSYVKDCILPVLNTASFNVTPNSLTIVGAKEPVVFRIDRYSNKDGMVIYVYARMIKYCEITTFKDKNKNWAYTIEYENQFFKAITSDLTIKQIVDFAHYEKDAIIQTHNDIVSKLNMHSGTHPLAAFLPNTLIFGYVNTDPLTIVASRPLEKAEIDMVLRVLCMEYMHTRIRKLPGHNIYFDPNGAL